jgi:hypothetical protein
MPVVVAESADAAPPVDGPGRGERLALLADEVAALIGDPVDALAVTAILESIGWRDADARAELGAPQLFALGEEVFAICRARATRAPQPDADDAPAAAFGGTARQFLRHYARGLLFATPMAGQIVLLLTLTYSLWAWLYFSERQATAVAVATLLSLVVAGGFTQAIGREGIYYLSQENGPLAKQACYRLVGLGSLTVLGCGALLVASRWATGSAPGALTWTGLMYFVLLSHLWVFLSILYVRKDFLAILLVTVLGVGPVHAVMRLSTWGIQAAHGVGLLVAIGLAAGYGYYRLTQAVRATRANLLGARLPPWSTTVYEVLPYFAYGVLYFAFLSVDRLNAWSAGVPADAPFPLRFRTAYEIGIAAALVSLMLTMAALQYTVHLFSEVLIARQETFRATEIRGHNAYFLRFYRRHMAVLVATGLGSVALGALAFAGVERAHLPAAITGLFATHVARLVFAVAAGAYFFLAVALFNVLFFFTLARPRLVLRSILPAVLVNAVVGYVASRGLGYEYASLGLFAGCVTFALVSTVIAVDVFEHFDFYYYSAY